MLNNWQFLSIFETHVEPSQGEFDIKNNKSLQQDIYEDREHESEKNN